MFEKMLFDMLGLDKDQAQAYVHNALASFQRFEEAISSIANDVEKIKHHLGIDTPTENVIEGTFEKKDDKNAA